MPGLAPRTMWAIAWGGSEHGSVKGPDRLPLDLRQARLVAVGGEQGVEGQRQDPGTEQLVVRHGTVGAEEGRTPGRRQEAPEELQVDRAGPAAHVAPVDDPREGPIPTHEEVPEVEVAVHDDLGTCRPQGCRLLQQLERRGAGLPETEPGHLVQLSPGA